MCVKISLAKFTDGFSVFWLLSCILIADCFVILTMLPFWGRSHFEYMHLFWMRSQFECVLILSVFSFWMHSHFECVLILNALSFWVCSHFECVLILNALSFECVLTLNAFSFWVCSHFDSIPRPHARLTRSHSPLSKEENKMAQVSSQGYVSVLEDIRRSLTSVIWQLRSPDVSEETINFFDTSIGATLTAFVAVNANCEYGQVRTNSSGRSDTLHLFVVKLQQPYFSTSFWERPQNGKWQSSRQNTRQQSKYRKPISKFY